MCKVNNADSVKVILPIWQLEELNESASDQIFMVFISLILL